MEDFGKLSGILKDLKGKFILSINDHPQIRETVKVTVIKPLPAFLVVYSGLFITDFSFYLVGKKYGRRIVEHKRFHKIISPNRLSKLEEKFSKWGSW